MIVKEINIGRKNIYEEVEKQSAYLGVKTSKETIEALESDYAMLCSLLEKAVQKSASALGRYAAGYILTQPSSSQDGLEDTPIGIRLSLPTAYPQSKQMLFSGILLSYLTAELFAEWLSVCGEEAGIWREFAAVKLEELKVLLSQRDEPQRKSLDNQFTYK